VSDTCFVFFFIFFEHSIFKFFHGSFCFVSDFRQKGKGFFFHFFAGDLQEPIKKVGASRLFLLQEFLCEKNVTQNEDKCVIFHPTW